MGRFNMIWYKDYDKKNFLTIRAVNIAKLIVLQHLTMEMIVNLHCCASWRRTQTKHSSCAESNKHMCAPLLASVPFVLTNRQTKQATLATITGFTDTTTSKTNWGHPIEQILLSMITNKGETASLPWHMQSFH